MHLHLALGRRARARVADARLREHHRAVGQHVAVEGEVVPGGIDDLRLRPGGARVVRLGDVGVAAARAVPRHVHVLAVVAHREDRLVVPAHLAVGLHRRRPGRAVVRGLREVHVEVVHPHRVHVAGVRHDLDDRVELALLPAAFAQELVGHPRDAAVARAPQHDVGGRAPVAARVRARVAGGHHVDPRGGRWPRRSPAPSRRRWGSRAARRPSRARRRPRSARSDRARRHGGHRPRRSAARRWPWPARCARPVRDRARPGRRPRRRWRGTPPPRRAPPPRCVVTPVLTLRACIIVATPPAHVDPDGRTLHRLARARD